MGPLVRWKDGRSTRTGHISSINASGEVTISQTGTGAARVVPAERIDIRTKGPRGGDVWLQATASIDMPAHQRMAQTDGKTYADERRYLLDEHLAALSAAERCLRAGLPALAKVYAHRASAAGLLLAQGIEHHLGDRGEPALYQFPATSELPDEAMRGLASTAAAGPAIAAVTESMTTIRDELRKRG